MALSLFFLAVQKKTKEAAAPSKTKPKRKATSSASPSDPKKKKGSTKPANRTNGRQTFKGEVYEIQGHKGDGGRRGG